MTSALRIIADSGRAPFFVYRRVVLDDNGRLTLRHRDGGPAGIVMYAPLWRPT